MKNIYTVWWFETQKFTGAQMRHYQDFDSETAAMWFAGNKVGRHISRIAEQPWHHSHGSISKANAGETE